MIRSKQACLLSGAATLTLSGVGFAASTEAGDTDARIAQLEAQVAALKAQQGDAWLTEARAEEIRGLVQDVLADADTRASLLQSGMTGGWDDGFFLASSDGNYRLNINGAIQSRFIYNNQDDGSDDSDRWGFEQRRTKLDFWGHIVNPSWKYRIEGDFDVDEGDFSLRDSWIKYDYGNGWSTAMGRFKAPLLREELVSYKYQLAVERSLLNSIFTAGRVTGLLVNYEADNFRLAGSANNGADDDAGTRALDEDTEYAFQARGEFLANGTWSQFDDFTSWQGEDMGILIGGAVSYQSEEYGTGDGVFVDANGDGIDDTPTDNEADSFIATIDASIEFGGANLFGAFVYSDTSGVSDNPFGFIVQGGFFFTEDFELFGRYEFVDPDADGIEDLSVATIGVNKYFSKHAVKWTTDVGYSFDEVQGLGLGGSADLEGAGYREDASGDDGQLVFRSQLQLLF
jgi:hypothetical protein